MTFLLQHLCSVGRCQRQLSRVPLHRGLLFRRLLPCARELGGAGQEGWGSAGSWQELWGGSAGESPEMSVTGEARLPYLGASFMEVHPSLLCKSSATQGKAINLSESLMSAPQLR